TLGRTLTKLVANTFKNVRFEWTCRIFSMFWTNICGKSLLPRMRRKERIYFPKCLESSPSNCGDIDVSLTQSVHVDSYDDRYELFPTFVYPKKKVTSLNPTLQLLKAKRTSALKDTRTMESELVRLNNKGGVVGVSQ